MRRLYKNKTVGESFPQKNANISNTLYIKKIKEEKNKNLKVKYWY